MIIDPNKIKTAKDWAESILASWPSDRARAAAEVIAALPNTIVDGEAVRTLIEDWETTTNESMIPANVIYWVAAESLKTLLPAPTPPTLADMTPEERKACQWRMVDTPGGEGVYYNQHIGVAAVIYPSGRHLFWSMEDVVPLLDRPGMVWPGQEDHVKTVIESSLEDMETGRVVEFDLGEETPTEQAPNPQVKPRDIPPGEVWIVEYCEARWVGTRESNPDSDYPWALAKMDGTNYGMAEDRSITLISHLVPEVQA